MSYVGEHHKLLIIANWFRTLVQSEILIEDICKIIVAFGKLYDRFLHYDRMDVEVTKDGTVARNLKFGNRSIYCKFNVPNQTKSTFKWRFKCCQMGDAEYWGIGFDATRNPIKWNDYFYNVKGNINYIYKANGDMWDCGKKITHDSNVIINKTPGWKQGDIITLIYNGKDRILSISINDEHIENSILKVKDSEGGFRVAVFMDQGNEQIELLP